MSLLTDISHIDLPAWEKLVEESRVESWWQTEACYRMYAASSGEMVPVLSAVMRDDRMVALCVGHMLASDNRLMRPLTRRMIIPGGPLLSDDVTVEEIRLLLDGLGQSGAHPIYREMRCFADYSPWRQTLESAGWAYEEHYDITVAVADWRERMHRSPRANIRKAIDQGETWRETRNARDMQAWYALLQELYRTKVRRPLPSLLFFLQSLQDGHTHLMVTEQDGHITGGCLLTVLPTTSARPARAYEWYKCGPVMSTYAALEWCETQGIEVLDLMGAGSPGVPYGVRDFKLQIGGELHEYGRYRSICQPLLYKIGVLGVNILKKW